MSSAEDLLNIAARGTTLQRFTAGLAPAALAEEPSPELVEGFTEIAESLCSHTLVDMPDMFQVLVDPEANMPWAWSAWASPFHGGGSIVMVCLPSEPDADFVHRKMPWYEDRADAMVDVIQFILMHELVHHVSRLDDSFKEFWLLAYVYARGMGICHDTCIHMCNVTCRDDTYIHGITMLEKWLSAKHHGDEQDEQAAANGIRAALHEVRPDGRTVETFDRLANYVVHGLEENEDGA